MSARIAMRVQRAIMKATRALRGFADAVKSALKRDAMPIERPRHPREFPVKGREVDCKRPRLRNRLQAKLLRWLEQIRRKGAY